MCGGAVTCGHWLLWHLLVHLFVVVHYPACICVYIMLIIAKQFVFTLCLKKTSLTFSILT